MPESKKLVNFFGKCSSGNLLSQTRREFRTALAEAGNLTNLRDAEKIGYDGLTAPVLVRPVGMQAIATATRFQVDQRQRQVIAAEKPLECVRRAGPPFEITVRTPRRKAG